MRRLTGQENPLPASEAPQAADKPLPEPLAAVAEAPAGAEPVALPTPPGPPATKDAVAESLPAVEEPQAGEEIQPVALPVPPDDASMADLLALAQASPRTLGGVIRRHLGLRGMTQAAASRRMGFMNRGQFNNLLDGRGAPWKEYRLRALLQVLELTAETLLAEARA